MKKFCLYTLCLLLIIVTQDALSQATEGIDSFKQERTSWRRKETTQDKPQTQITQKIKDGISVFGLSNITDAEQVFCYNIDTAAKGYNGYTINGMAITGFCGLVEKNDTNLFITEFFTKDEATSNQVAQCIIEPKIMLRFVKGIDFTDILLSSPCHSFTIFYGGKLKTFNAMPSAQLIDAYVNVYSSRKTEFVSPALLNQLYPIGVAITPEHKTLLKEKSGDAPIRKWEKEKNQETAQEKPSEKKGWNKLKR